ncbi:hypothetical protein PPTG_24646 [Phytophthora nicotianae INRA-310]|uniref:Uncharacterized protein n=1 Tax=Phytophthora nicotianae (strain INRA-310) TaxID=761204 RepID=W2PDS9_PHYN3|nr:hypothetical protein PPTG_24646 [Phytophthora nicotianae INRA-310]ETM98348.1 hypothetical protein PPTG_24646 [Phytophthora nicotianae INRA-310]
MGRTSPAQAAVVEAIARRKFPPLLSYPEMISGTLLSEWLPLCAQGKAVQTTCRRGRGTPNGTVLRALPMHWRGEEVFFYHQ